MQTSQSNEESSTDSEGEEQQEQHQNHRHRRWFTVLQSMSLVAVLLLAVYNHALIDAGPEETLATPWLVESEPFEPLAPCNEGGSRLHTGFDVNGNGMLDLGERMDTVVLCHGLRGLSGPQGQPGTVGRQILQKTTQAMATGDDRDPGNVGVNHRKVALGFGCVRQVDDEASGFLSRLPFLARQLVQQTLGRLHGLSSP